MITTRSKEAPYLVEFSNGTHTAQADAPIIKGGQGSAMGPHELLEASVACCINMWIRMQADKLGVPIDHVEVQLSLKRDHPEQSAFEYSIAIAGPISEAQRAALLEYAETCPVRQTLAKKLSFKQLCLKSHL